LCFAVYLIQASALRLGRVDQPEGFLQGGSEYFKKGLADLDLTAAEVEKNSAPSASPDILSKIPADVSMEAQAIAAIAMANNMSVADAKAKLDHANLIVERVKAKEQEVYDASRIAVAEGITRAEALDRIHAIKAGKAPKPAAENPVKEALAKAAPAKAAAEPAEKAAPAEAPKPAKENPVKAALAKAAPAKAAEEPAKKAAPAEAPKPAKENPVKAALAKAAPAKAAPAKAAPAKAAAEKAAPAPAKFSKAKATRAKTAAAKRHYEKKMQEAKKEKAAHAAAATASLDAATRKSHNMVTTKMGHQKRA